MAFKFPPLPVGVPLVGKDGAASRTFARFWQKLGKAIETQETRQDSLDSAILAALEQAGIAVDTANAALDAAGAIMPDIAPVTIQADYTGAVLAGQLPRNIAAQRFDGDTDVTTSSAWSAATVSGGATYTIGAGTGILNLTAIDATTVIEITSDYNDIERSKKLTIFKALQDPPPSSSSGTEYDSTIEPTTSDSYGAANAGITVTCGASGEVELSAPLAMSVIGEAAGSYAAKGKWQVSAAGADSWTDVDTEMSNSAPAVVFADETQSDGYIAVNQTATGLTPSSDYDFRLLLRNSAAGGHTIYYTGTASGTTS